MPEQIAEKSIRRCRWRWPPGPLAERSIGGSRNGKSRGVVCAVQMVVSGGSKLLIFVQPRASDGHRRLMLSKSDPPFTS